MREWEERMKRAGAKVFETGLCVQNTPDEEGLIQCKDFGRRFGASVEA